MNAPLLILIAALVASPVYAEQEKKESGLTKVLRTMFPSAKPKVVRQKRSRKSTRTSRSTPQPTPITNHKYQTVDIDWMARYWEEEAAWDYYIPEDNLIRFVDGKYIVPIVVYRHYEDMAKTPRRTPPLSNPVPIEG